MIPFIRTDKYHKLEKKFLLDKKYFFHPFYRESWQSYECRDEVVWSHNFIQQDPFLPWKKDWGAIYELLPINALKNWMATGTSSNYCNSM